MKRIHFSPVGVILCLLGLAATIIFCGRASGRGEQLLGKPAPLFYESAVNGWSQSLAKYKGKVVLLDFWATWCGPCVKEMPNVKKIYEKFKGKDFVIIGISLDTERKKLRNYIREKKISWPIVFDGRGWKNKVAQKYEVHAIPFTVLIDRKGIVRQVGLRGDSLERAVSRMLSGQSK